MNRRFLRELGESVVTLVVMVGVSVMTFMLAGVVVS